VAGEVRIAAAGRELPGYRAMPATGDKHPVVIVVHEIFGMHEYVRDVCRRLAKQGYPGIARDLFARQGDVRGRASIDESAPSLPRCRTSRCLRTSTRWRAGSPATKATAVGWRLPVSAGAAGLHGCMPPIAHR